MGKKIRRQITSAWVDETLSVKAIKVIHQVVGCNPKLESQIGELLGDYRLTAAYRDTQPTLDESKQHMEKTVRAIDELIGYMELMPEYCNASIAAKNLDIGGNHELENDIKTYRVACRAVLADLERTRSRKGERPKKLEHRLLSGVDSILETYVSGAEERAGKASEILRAAGIKQMPVDNKKARAAILAYRL